MKRKHRRIKRCIIEYIREVYCRSVMVALLIAFYGALLTDYSIRSKAMLCVLFTYTIIALPILYYMALKDAENMED